MLSKSKGLKNPTSKLLCVWARNHLRFENLNRKLIFNRVFILSSNFCHFLQLWKITPFFNKFFFGFVGGGPSPAYVYLALCALFRNFDIFNRPFSEFTSTFYFTQRYMISSNTNCVVGISICSTW